MFEHSAVKDYKDFQKNGNPRIDRQTRLDSQTAVKSIKRTGLLKQQSTSELISISSIKL